MTNLSALQKLDLFNSFARQWQRTFDSPLLLLSPQGELVGNFDGAPRLNGMSLVAGASLTGPTCLTVAGQPVLVAPLLSNGQPLAYILALNAREQQASLLGWAAETIMAHLLDDEALKDMTDELIGAWNQLELVYRVTQNLSLTTDLMAALQTILSEVKKVVHTQEAFILLQQDDTLECVTCTEKWGSQIDCQVLLDNLIKAEHLILCDTPSACRRLWPQAPGFVKNMLATELDVQDEVKAALGLVNKIDKDFTAGDTKLLAALAQQVSIIIKNFLQHQHALREERLSRELEIAAEIQKSLLPTSLPQVGTLSIAVSSAPASEVGGDFYDFITADDRHLTLIIGDVAGKGVPAALLTSVTRTMLRVEAMRGEPPHRIIQQANSVLYQDLSRADSFVTVFVATIDTFTGVMQYASAGHMPAIVWRSETRTVEQLKATSPPVGIFQQQGGITHTVNINAGDSVVFYTDGITEAQAPNGELFGLRRLLYIIESRADDPPELLQQYIQSEIGSFRRDSLSRDDATLLIIKMHPRSKMATPKDISTILKTITLSYPADIQYLTNIAADITQSCRQLPTLPNGPNADDFIYLIELAISEICTNIIQHAYAGRPGEIDASITLLNNGIQLDFYDQGASFDPSSVPQPNSDPHQLVEGGYGLHIVRQIMDVVSYEHDPERGNHWHLIKFLPPSS